jgi:ATP-dependent DNA helicase RecQ
MLLNYFGEKDSTRCGKCDVCENLQELGISNLEYRRIVKDIKLILQKEAVPRHELFFKLSGNESHIQKVLRWLLDNGSLHVRIDEKLEWKDS